MRAILRISLLALALGAAGAAGCGTDDDSDGGQPTNDDAKPIPSSSIPPQSTLTVAERTSLAVGSTQLAGATPGAVTGIRAVTMLSSYLQEATASRTDWTIANITGLQITDGEADVQTNLAPGDTENGQSMCQLLLENPVVELTNVEVAAADGSVLASCP